MAAQDNKRYNLKNQATKRTEASNGKRKLPETGVVPPKKTKLQSSKPNSSRGKSGSRTRGLSSLSKSKSESDLIETLLADLKENHLVWNSVDSTDPKTTVKFLNSLFESKIEVNLINDSVEDSTKKNNDIILKSFAEISRKCCKIEDVEQSICPFSSNLATKTLNKPTTNYEGSSKVSTEKPTISTNNIDNTFINNLIACLKKELQWRTVIVHAPEEIINRLLLHNDFCLVDDDEDLSQPYGITRISEMDSEKFKNIKADSSFKKVIYTLTNPKSQVIVPNNIFKIATSRKYFVLPYIPNGERFITLLRNLVDCNNIDIGITLVEAVKNNDVDELQNLCIGLYYGGVIEWVNNFVYLFDHAKESVQNLVRFYCFSRSISASTNEFFVSG